MTNKEPEALRLATELEQFASNLVQQSAQELRRQHARIVELEAQLAAGTHKPAEAVHQIAEPAEYPEIDPALFSGNGVLWALIYTWSDDDNEVAARNVDEHIQSMMRAYVEADRAQRASTPQAVQPAAPLPLLLRDIARDLGITVPQACIALKPLGNYSTNSAVTAEMARMLRDHFPAPAHPAEWVPAQAAKLPPLPEPTAFLVCKGSEVTARAWNVDQMRAYAAAALAATQPAAQVLDAQTLKHISALSELVRMPNAEYFADAHNAAVRHLRALAAQAKQVGAA